MLAVANIYYGMINVRAAAASQPCAPFCLSLLCAVVQVRRVGAWAVISYSVVLGLILGAGILKDSVDYLRLPPPGAAATRRFSCRWEEREAQGRGEDGNGARVDAARWGAPPQGAMKQQA